MLGGAKKSFSTDKIVLEKNTTTINELISHLMQIKPKDTLEFDTKNLLIAVNGVDSSALQGYDTKLSDNDEISIIPIIHGGSSHRIQFSVAQSNVEIFDILFDKRFHRDFLDELRNKHKHLIIQAINPQFLLSVQHAKKVLAISLHAKKPRPCFRKKLKQTFCLDLQSLHRYQQPLRLWEEK
uniref:Molybdopterin n=1 Tax=uncultured marine thaumarchaeote KM3_98_C03 TaxID=1456352 RepID=A0A075HZS2_9ARCH|nr:molybdopterin [uncultured marine thaumarchaeote KM3_98_C03]